MADTLSEIYNDTLVGSDFNSSGEATILTTNSSTAHVIKNVQVVEGNSDVPVGGNIDVNGFNVVALTANSSGSEIIAPSSTVKVKTSSFPLDYEDTSFIIQETATTFTSVSEAKLNNAIQPSPFVATGQSIGYSQTLSEDRRIFIPNLGPNNYQLIVRENSAKTTFQVYSKTSSGTNNYTFGSAYNCGWWDGSQYFYFTDKDTNNIQRLDTFTGTTNSTFHNYGSISTNSNPRMVGVKDKFLFFWLHNGSGGTKFYNFTTGTSGTFTTQDANQTFANTDKEFYCVQRTDGTFIMMVVDAVDNIKWWKFTEADIGGTNVGGGGTGYTTLTPTGTERFGTYQRMHSAVGTKLFYINNQERLCSWDFATDTPVHKVEYDTVLTAYSNDTHVAYHINTPDSTTIAARNYGTAPSLGLRITGVTST